MIADPVALATELAYWRAVARAYPDWHTAWVRRRITKLERQLKMKRRAA
jgi:hypothetical protein